VAHLNDAQGKALASYLRVLADEMGLRDWRIHLHERPSRKGSGAAMNCTTGRKIVEVWVNAKFAFDDPDAQRHYLVHELVHVHFWPLEVERDDVAGQHDSAWMRDHAMRERRIEELGVDAMADLLAPFMPLPPDLKRIGEIGGNDDGAVSDAAPTDDDAEHSGWRWPGRRGTQNARGSQGGEATP
jgi:hypothetical protein